MPPTILTIAGFDPSSGAGITADIKTAAAHGCYAVGCITALTIQNTQGVRQVEPISAKVVADTLNRLADDGQISAVRIGMLGSGAVARAVADFLERYRLPNVVLDPVLKSSSGSKLIDAEGLEVLVKRLLPQATVVTPNLAEASVLAGMEVRSLDEMRSAAVKIGDKGAKNVLITGGHLAENTDLLRLASGQEHEIRGKIVESSSTHGTGCAHATAIACQLAQGKTILAASREAKEYVRQAIEAAYKVGRGIGPINHLFRLRP